jgi:hypothetical protein
LAQHLCIVARDNPLLLGYLSIALRHLTAGGDELEIVIDRRPDPSTVNGSSPPPPGLGLDQRRLDGLDAMLRSQGYAIVSREPGEAWHLGNGSERLVEESDQAGGDDAVEPAALEYRGSPIRRRTLLAGAAVAVVVLGASVGIPGRSPEAPPPVSPAARPPSREPTQTAALVTPPVATDSPPPVVSARVGPANVPAPLERAPVPAVEPPSTPVPRVDLPPRPAPAGVDSSLPSRDEGVAPATEKPVDVRGAPRVEMSRERDASGRTAALVVRVTDPGGRPLPAAEVRIRRRLTDGAVRETRLQATTPEGSYRGPLPAAAPNTDGLTMRITIGEVSHEVPLAE